MNSNAIYMSIADAKKATGLSLFFLRTGCKNNTIPHIKCGAKYLINVPKLLEMLEEQENSNIGE